MARSRRRLGIGGEFLPPGPNPAWQQRFLEAVAEHAPQCPAELHSLAQHPNAETPEARWEADERLRAWCARWHFVGVVRTGTHDWLRQIARRTIAAIRNGEAFGPGFVSMAVVMRPPSGLPSLKWHPHLESEADFDARVAAYKAHVVEALERQGWRRNDDKRDADHVRWLALFQIGQLAPAEIAERCDPDGTGCPDVNTVRLALAPTASLVGLALRRAPRGRPGKKRS